MTRWATRVPSTTKNDRLHRALILSGPWLANRVPSKPFLPTSDKEKIVGFSTLDERFEWVRNGVGWELRPFKKTEVEFECNGRFTT